MEAAETIEGEAPVRGEQSSIWSRLTEHGEAIARLDVEVRTLRESTERLEGRIAELKTGTDRGFERLEQAVSRVHDRALEAYTPQAAQQLADTRAREAQAKASSRQSWAVTAVLAFVTLGAVLWPVVHP